MTGLSFAYAPGDWVALVGHDVWGLVALEIGDPRVPALWEAASAGIEDVLDVLLSKGLRALPGFALVGSEGEALRYAVRGPASLRTRSGEDPSELDGAGSDSWSSGKLDADTLEIELKGVAQGELRLPTALGVMPASALFIDLTRAGTERQDNGSAIQRVEASQAATPPAEAPQAEAPQAEAPQAEAPQTEPSHAEEPQAVVASSGLEDEPLAEDGGGSNGHVETYYQLLVSSTMERDALLEQLMEDITTEAQADSAGGFTAGQEQSVVGDRAQSEATSVWADDLAPTTDSSAADVAPGASSAVASAGQSTELDAQSQPSKGAGIIDGVPWASGGQSGMTPRQPSAPTPVPVPVPVPSVSETPPYPSEPPNPATADDDLSLTISKAGLLRQLAEERQRGPKLLALRCEHGHLSSPYAVTCRVCGTPLADQEPEEVTRPPLGQLSLSNGGTVMLDKGVIFGRAPQSDEEDAAKRPNLVKLVESGEISRMHASIALDGWQVLLRDLGSQNGTFLTLPGREPEQIRPNKDYVLEPGAVISFADVVSCTFEVAQ